MYVYASVKVYNAITIVRRVAGVHAQTTGLLTASYKPSLISQHLHVRSDSLQLCFELWGGEIEHDSYFYTA